ncbi:uncharacterized protein LOC114526892 [Dendronephthya gigantea]|uniref:uncharacterized protein LOC114526892 n=1 Tax=Dendronephthya gigantea TaxID=151771 RepID=UPI00106C1FE2|nr:uncharacterized protein LOC114526892 [Dendronephthya gigantea]
MSNRFLFNFARIKLHLFYLIVLSILTDVCCESISFVYNGNHICRFGTSSVRFVGYAGRQAGRDIGTVKDLTRESKSDLLQGLCLELCCDRKWCRTTVLSRKKCKEHKKDSRLNVRNFKAKIRSLPFLKKDNLKGQSPSKTHRENKAKGRFIQEQRAQSEVSRLEKRSLSDSSKILPSDPSKRKRRLTRIRFIKVKEIHPDAPEPHVFHGHVRESVKSEQEQRKDKNKNAKVQASNGMPKAHSATVLTKIIDDVNHILKILDKKTKSDTFSNSEKKSKVSGGKFSTPKQDVSRNKNSSSQKKDHQRILEIFFNSQSNSDGHDDGYHGDGNHGDDDHIDDRIEGSHDSLPQNKNVDKVVQDTGEKKSGEERLNHFEDDLENEVNNLLVQLGSDFSGESHMHSQQPENIVALSSNDHIGFDGAKSKDHLNDPDGLNSNDAPFHTKRNNAGNTQPNGVYHLGTTPDTDEDILDMITNILQDHPSPTTNAGRDNDSEDNSYIDSYNNTNLIQSSSNISKGEVLAVNSTVSRLKEDETELFYNLDDKLIAKDGNSMVPAENTNVHHTIEKAVSGGRSRSGVPATADEDLNNPQRIGGLRDTSLLQNEDSSSSKSKVKSVEKNYTDFALKFEKTPTPSSQLLQTFPGAISYNVKLANEESPPGKGAQEKPAHQESVVMRKSKNNTNSFIPNKFMEHKLDDKQTMTHRIFEVGQAAIEAGKNMIFAQESHVDEKKIYDIVGTKNVTSVGRYLITIGEELLNRGKTLSSREVSSKDSSIKEQKFHPSRNGSKSNSKVKSENLINHTSRINGSLENLGKSNNGSMSATSSYSGQENQNCTLGSIHRHASLRGKMRAGLFIPTGQVKELSECATRCCEDKKCNMALVVNEECYKVECFHWTLCQVVSYRGSSKFQSTIIDIRRRRMENSHTTRKHDSLNISRPLKESKRKRKSKKENVYKKYLPVIESSVEAQRPSTKTNLNNSNILSSPINQSQYSKRPNKIRNLKSRSNRPQTENVQREELNCRSSSTNGTGYLKPGSWLLSGTTNSSGKCVDLCCSQNGCDLAFQIGEFCYSLACYKDSRRCNPLSIPVGLSYLRLKRRRKLAKVAKATHVSNNKLTENPNHTMLSRNHDLKKTMLKPSRKNVVSKSSATERMLIYRFYG